MIRVLPNLAAMKTGTTIPGRDSQVPQETRVYPALILYSLPHYSEEKTTLYRKEVQTLGFASLYQGFT